MTASIPRPKVWQHRRLITEHAFDKLRLIDCTLAEFDAALVQPLIIEETELSHGDVKELLLLIEWARPLHVVVVVDDVHAEERIVTIYEPHDGRWGDGYRVRR